MVSSSLQSRIPGFQFCSLYMLLASVILPFLFDPVIFLTSVVYVGGLNISNTQRLPGVGDMRFHPC